MDTPDANSDDTTEAGARPPLVDPSGLSLQIVQKLADSQSEMTAPPPRPSIAHLFLWTTLSAMIMALGRSVFLRDLAGFEPEHMQVPRTAHWYTMSALNGLICSGFCIVVARKWRSPAVRIEPGEWLLVIRGISFLMQVTTFGLMGLSTEAHSLETYAAAQSINLLADAALAIWATLRVGPHRAWRWLFATGGITAAVNLVLLWGFDMFTWVSWSSASYYAGVLIECMLLVLAMVQDKRKALTRNWLHWLGVITFVLSVVFFVGWEIVWRFLVE